METWKTIECLDKYEVSTAGRIRNKKYWAHNKFVEKEKKYVWTLKRTAAWNGVENYKRLFRTVNGDISDVLKEKDEDIYEEEYLTETEISECGYNPEMFDKEEVD